MFSVSVRQCSGSVLNVSERQYSSSVFSTIVRYCSGLASANVRGCSCQVLCNVMHL